MTTTRFPSGLVGLKLIGLRKLCLTLLLLARHRVGFSSCSGTHTFLDLVITYCQYTFAAKPSLPEPILLSCTELHLLEVVKSCIKAVPGVSW